MPDEVHVFVYGTLRRGEDNDINLLHPHPRFVGPATVEGDLFDFGRHPGIVLREGGPRVLGEVYACAPELIAALDDVELNYPERPGLYRQAFCEIDCAERTLRCLVYELADQGASSLGPLSGSGVVDWVSLRLERTRADDPGS